MRRGYTVEIPVRIQQTEGPDALAPASDASRRAFREDQVRGYLSFEVTARSAEEAKRIVETALLWAVDAPAADPPRGGH